MILAAVDEQCLHEVLIIAAALEIQDPRERPVEKQQAADLCHARFADQSSDFLSYLALWDFYHNLRSQLSRNQLRRACQKNFLSFNRMREWLDIHRQLKQLISDADLQKAPVRPSREADPEERYTAIHRALLTGLLSNIALRGDAHQYLGCGGAKFYLWPGSGVFKEKPLWIMAAELVETTQNYTRTVARISPTWIEPLAGHLLKRSYSEPHWSRRTGSAMAYEKVTLAGLPIVQRRRVRFGPIEPEASRELLIRHGLVEGQLKTAAGFFQHNQTLLAEIESSATKARRTDLFVGEEQLIDFYDTRIPHDVYDAARLHSWLRTMKRKQPRALYMTPEDLIGDAAVEESAEQFPGNLDVGPASLPLEYRFEPGNDDDGITVTVPQAALSQLDDGRLGWLVPGLLEQKVLALIRSLPKSIRRNFVPAPETAKRVVQQIRFGEGPFLQAVADTLRRVSGEHVSPRDFQLDRLPQHLQMNVRVVDEQGQELSSARNLEQLQQDLGGAVTSGAPLVQDSAWHRNGISTWDFGELPESVVVACGGIPLTFYPALVEQDEQVALRLADSSELAAHQTRGGLRRLCCLAMGRELRSQVTWLPRLDQLKLYAATLCGPKLLEEQLAELIADRAFLDRDVVPRNADEFSDLFERGQQRIGIAVDEVARFARPLLEAYHQARLGLEGATSPNWKYAVEDMWQQLQQLAPGDFIAKTPWAWLQHCPRYLTGIDVRLKKLASSGWQRDGHSYEQIRPLLAAYRQRVAEHQQRGIDDIHLQHFRWMLEEFRVSLFAQELRTSIPVSAKRLERQWAKVQ
jgi:ATP-dependent helicase HrpA